MPNPISKVPNNSLRPMSLNQIAQNYPNALQECLPGNLEDLIKRVHVVVNPINKSIMPVANSPNEFFDDSYCYVVAALAILVNPTILRHCQEIYDATPDHFKDILQHYEDIICSKGIRSLEDVPTDIRDFIKHSKKEVIAKYLLTIAPKLEEYSPRIAHNISHEIRMIRTIFDLKYKGYGGCSAGLIEDCLYALYDDKLSMLEKGIACDIIYKDRDDLNRSYLVTSVPPEHDKYFAEPVPKFVFTRNIVCTNPEELIRAEKVRAFKANVGRVEAFNIKCCYKRDPKTGVFSVCSLKDLLNRDIIKYILVGMIMGKPGHCCAFIRDKFSAVNDIYRYDAGYGAIKRKVKPHLGTLKTKNMNATRASLFRRLSDAKVNTIMRCWLHNKFRKKEPIPRHILEAVANYCLKTKFLFLLKEMRKRKLSEEESMSLCEDSFDGDSMRQKRYRTDKENALSPSQLHPKRFYRKKAIQRRPLCGKKLNFG